MGKNWKLKRLGAVVAFVTTIGVGLLFQNCSGGFATNTDILPSEGTEALPQKVTFNDHIGPLLKSKCSACHREGGIKQAIQFNTFTKAKGYAGIIEYDVESRRMPPWPIAEGAAPVTPGFTLPSFKDTRSLTTVEVALIKKWVKDGMLEGSGGTKDFSGEDPDSLTGANVVELKMPQKFTPNPPAPKIDQYRCFVLNPISANEVWMTAFQVVADQFQQVHHIILYKPLRPEDETTAVNLDATDSNPGYDCVTSAGTGVLFETLALWTPGTGVTKFPAGTALRVQANRKLILQVHYNTSGGTLPDQSAMRVEVQNTRGTLKEAFWYSPGYPSGTIPAGQADTKVEVENTIHTWFGKSGINIHGIYPHMHLLGLRMHSEYTPAGSTTMKPLFDMKEWDFNWQTAYFFPDDKPMMLGSGDKLKVTCHYNTQSVTSPVNFGENTKDEMCYAFLYITFEPPLLESAQLLSATGPITQRSVSAQLKIWPPYQGQVGILFVSATIGADVYTFSSPTSWRKVAADGKFDAFSVAGPLPVEIPSWQLVLNADLSIFAGGHLWIGYGIGATVPEAQLDMQTTPRTLMLYDIN